MLRRNYLPEQFIEETLEGKIDMTVRRGRSGKQLLGVLMERRGYCSLKEVALDRTAWRTGFRRHHGPVVR
jgi:hypothetical protein